MRKELLLMSIVSGSIGLGEAHASQLVGPQSYLSFSDSPFASVSFADYFHLENFEDGLFNVPGVTADSATGTPYTDAIGFPGVFTDSVDGDDGSIDGAGTAGHSYLPGSNTPGSNNEGVKFIFDASILGGLPSHAGFVWTDGFSGDQTVEFMAFDAFGDSLGSVVGTIGDTSFSGGTEEDRFFGVINEGGISAIQIRTTSPINGNALEVDHLQYGLVPEPATSVLLGAVGVAVLARRRQ